MTEAAIDMAADKSNDKKEVKPVKKEAPSKKGPSIANLACALILKHTGQKPVRPSFSTMAHIGSGSTVINNLIGGSPSRDGKGLVCPGYPRRRITELYGAESSGKTSAALAAVVDCQKKGGVVAFLDFEHALSDSYAKAIGVDYDPEKFLLFKPDTLEEGINMMYLLIRSGVSLIVVDSVASMMPKDEYEKQADEVERIGSLAAPLTRNLKKMVIWLAKYPDPVKEKDKEGCAVIFINQTRSKIGGGGHGDEEQTPGGKALKFFSSIRIKLTRIRSESIKKKNKFSGKDETVPYGNVTIVKMVKNKVDSKQGAQGQIFIRYGSGIDDIYSIIETAWVNKLAKKDGAWIQYGTERFQGREKFRAYLMENPKVVEELKSKIAEAIAKSSVEMLTADEDGDSEESLEAQIRADLGSEGDEAILEADIETPEIAVVDEEEA